MEQLARFMQERNLTQAELARQLQVTPELVSLVLNGKRPITGTFRWHFGQAFGFDTAQQVFSVEPPPVQTDAAR